MKIGGWNFLASLAVHVALFGAAAVVGLPRFAGDGDREPVPMYFEVVDAAEFDSEEPENAKEPEPVPVDSEPVPVVMDPVPDEPEHAPVVMDPVPDEPEPDSVERARVVSEPVALNKIMPAYPRSARRRGHEGRVTVEACVDADGGVSDAEVAVSSGHGELDRAALGAVMSARFAPATEDGAAKAGRVRITLDFRLR